MPHSHIDTARRHVAARHLVPALVLTVVGTAAFGMATTAESVAGDVARHAARGTSAGATVGTAQAGTPQPGGATLPAAPLAGTWTFDRQASAVGSGRGGGVPGFPQANQLVIRVTPADVSVDSDTGSAGATQTSIYKLDGSTTDVPGPLGWKTTAKAAWQNESLVVTVRRTIDGPNGPIGANVTDTYSVTGTVLTVERRLGATVQKLIYNRKP